METNLEKWRGKVEDAKAKLKVTRSAMDRREKLYRGAKDLMKPMVEEEDHERGPVRSRHVFNLIAENINSEIDINIPQPKVTAVRKQDEPLAKMIEDFVRSEIERMHMEEMNDQQERIVPVQGGGYWLIGWDNEKRTHSTVGEVFSEVRHPKQILPQPGVYTSIEDMAFIAMEVPKTKEEILRRYGLDLSGESESDMTVKSADGAETATDMVTQVIIYYRNKAGGIGRYSYVNEHELENIEDYGARQRRRCAKCGATEQGTERLEASMPTSAGERPEGARKHRMDECPYCGSRKWEVDTDDYRTLTEDYVVQVGSVEKVLPAYETVLDEFGQLIKGEPVKYPYYRSNMYPLILQRNISVFGQLLGESDVDLIEDQQNAVNWLNRKLDNRVHKAGTKISLPADVEITRERDDQEVIRLDRPEQAGQIGVFDFTGDLSQALAYRSEIYEEARRVLGITNSFQGREDTTATSGVAKQFAAQQSAGRLESKRRMKNAAYERIFELIFKTALANADEPRPMKWRENGQTVYGEFDPMAFYEQDDAGEWYVNDRFLFGTDSSTALASNRTGMWQETTAQYSAGTFGDPMQDDTRLLYWRIMEELHYPMAGMLVTEIKERQEQQAAMMAQQAMLQQPMEQPRTSISIEELAGQMQGGNA